MVATTTASAQPNGPRTVPEGTAKPKDLAPRTQPAELGEIRGLTIRPERGYVDVTAKVVRRKADWLELLVTTPGMREHEALLATRVRPRQIHLGLLMLGLKPGRPIDVIERDEEWITQPPKGPGVHVRLLYERNGKQRNVPANDWIINRNTDKMLARNRWLFTGSLFATFEGERIYMADRSGSVITLVGFGDDLLTRETTMTNRTDAKQWTANTKLLPPKGAKVTVRLTPAPPQENAKATTQPEPRPAK